MGTRQRKSANTDMPTFLVHIKIIFCTYIREKIKYSLKNHFTDIFQEVKNLTTFEVHSAVQFEWRWYERQGKSRIPALSRGQNI